MDINIHFILDRSGSMWETLNDTIGGFNSFINSQKKQIDSGEQKCLMSLYQFDHEYDILYKNKDIEEVDELNKNTFVPRGQTALIDAIGRTISEISVEINNEKSNERENKIIVVILTDGMENCSIEFKHRKVMDLIKKKEKQGWQFVFLAANQDAIETAGNLGINRKSAMTYSQTPQNVRACFNGLSEAVWRSRTGDTNGVEFTPQERQSSQN